MTSYSNGGFFNHGYHDSETLEVDRRFSNKPQHTNPYATEDLAWRDERVDAYHSSTGQTGRNYAVERVPWDGRQEESWQRGENLPMGPISTNPGRSSWQHEINHSTFQTPADPSSARHFRLPSVMSGNMSIRWRGLTMRSTSMLSDVDPIFRADTEDALKDEMKNEEQNLVKEIVAMSMRDQIRALRDLPMSFEEKKRIRNQVLAFQSHMKSRQFTCFTDCSKNVSLAFRRFGYSLKSARQALQLWQGTMKEIGGKFGTSVLNYFLFLKFLLMFNILSFLINFGFITIPLLVYDPTPNVTGAVRFRGLEILTGAGYFNYTAMYYGSYSNETIAGPGEYNMQLAYFFTISLYMVLCGIVVLVSMAKSFKKNYVLADSASSSAWQLLCTWDFTVTNEKAVRQRKNNLCVQLKESLSEKAQKETLTRSEKLRHLGIHLASWFLSTSLAFGCGVSIYYLCKYEQERTTDTANWSPQQEAETLLVPFMVSLMNLVVPLLYSLFNKFEIYSSHRRQIYALVLRNVFLKMSILAVMSYYWVHVVAKKFSCWESMVGQVLYRLVIIDFIFLMLGSLFGEFLSNVIGTKYLPSMGVPEFDVARNVLELIYAQTLAWIGIYFSPLLPLIQILKFFILFYVKKVSLIQNCQPPRRSGRAAQMKTIFIALLFFPSFVGALSIVAYTAWSLTPSEQCGPFRGLRNSFSAIGEWIDDLQKNPGSEWAVWIYENVIHSEVFYFFISLIVMITIYIVWQVTEGRKLLIVRLRQRIVNEGKDKSFLLDKLRDLQQSNNNPKPNDHKKDHSSGAQSSSNALVQELLALRRIEEEAEERHSVDGVPFSSDLSTSDALLQAMMARQRAEEQDPDLHQVSSRSLPPSDAMAQAMQARQAVQLRERDHNHSAAAFPEESAVSALTLAMQARQTAENRDGLSSPGSTALMQAMQARQTAQEPPQNPALAGSSALIQAMLARQQAQNEYDDGY